MTLSALNPHLLRSGELGALRRRRLRRIQGLPPRGPSPIWVGLALALLTAGLAWLVARDGERPNAFIGGTL